jgi:hypothetical protein
MVISVSKDKGVDWVNVGLLIWMFLSFLGILYSFRFLFSAMLLLAIIIWMTPRTNKMNRGYEALKIVWAYQRGEAPRPSEEVFKTAADCFMHGDYEELRQEDMHTHKRFSVPPEVRQYIKSVRELPRRRSTF